eukprot:g1065.t1
MPFRVCTYNIEHFNKLFNESDEAEPPNPDEDTRYGVTAQRQLEAAAHVISQIDPDLLLIIEAPGTSANGNRNTAHALQNFAHKFNLRCKSATIGFNSSGHQEIAMMFDPDRVTVTHDPEGRELAMTVNQLEDLTEQQMAAQLPTAMNILTGRKVSPAPRFDTVYPFDSEDDRLREIYRFTRAPFEARVGIIENDAEVFAFRMIGAHIKSKGVFDVQDEARDELKNLSNRRRILAECSWVRERVEEYLERNEPVLVAGDFNDGPGLDYYEARFGRSGIELVAGDLDNPDRILRTLTLKPRWSGSKGWSPATASFYQKESGKFFNALIDFILVSDKIFDKAKNGKDDYRIWNPFEDKNIEKGTDLYDALKDASDHFPAAFRALAEAGPNAVRAEAIARDLKVSKGSFYWHFKDVPALKRQMLSHWQDKATDAIIAHVEAGGGTPQERLSRLVEVSTVSDTSAYGGVQVEAAIRDWARYDDNARAALKSVDERRVAYVQELFSNCGFEKAASRSKALLLYGGLIGLEALSVHSPIDRSHMGSITSLFVRKVVAAAGPDVDSDDLLSSVGLDVNAKSDPKQMVSDTAYYGLIERIAKDHDITELPLVTGASMRCDDYGALGLAFKAATTLQGSFARVERYARLWTSVVEYELRPEGATVWFFLHRAGPRRLGLRISNEATMASAASIAREVSPDGIFHPLEVHLQHAAPETTLAHERYFGCPVRFGSDRDALLLSKEMLQRQNRLGDEGITRFLLGHLDQELASLDGTRSLARRTRDVIARALSEGVPKMEDVARRLGVSVRSLHRHLAEDGLSFQTLAEETRKDLAVALLKQEQYSIAEIAFLTGFSEQSAFTRAFKRWLGETPASFRKSG